MKIMLVGNWEWSQYEEAFEKGLNEAGVKVIRFEINKHVNGLISRMERRLYFPGLNMLQINLKILRGVKNESPDLVLFWRPTCIFPWLIRKIVKLGVKTISYNNDDPFGWRKQKNAPWDHGLMWYWYLRTLNEYDFNFFYRRLNCSEALEHGAKHADIMLPYFMPWRERDIDASSYDCSNFETDVVFVGHYEEDGRVNAIKKIIQVGIRLKIWGATIWENKLTASEVVSIGGVCPANGEDYVRAICSSKVALCFLSKLNRDTYTRRCFEIPACKRVLLAERTADLKSMFIEDVEACFFSTHEEMIDKINWLLSHDEIRDGIAQAGYERVWKDGHDVFSRADEFLRNLSERGRL